MNRLLIAFVLVLTGCATSPQFDLDMSLTEASEMALQTDPGDREISSGSSSFFSSGINTSVDASVGLIYQDEYYDDGFFGGEHRFLIGRQSAINSGINRYNISNGYQLAYVGGDHLSQIRLAIYYTEASFPTDATAGLVSPLVLGFDTDIHKLYTIDSVAFILGARITSAQLAFDFESPLFINGSEITGDSVNYFGLGMPTGLQMEIGSFALEALITPMMVFLNDTSNVGFDNNIGWFNFNIPMSFSAGFVF